MKHALVTGGLGFIGSAFVRLTTLYGIKTTVIDNYTYASDEQRVYKENPVLSIISADICNQEI